MFKIGNTKLGKKKLEISNRQLRLSRKGDSRLVLFLTYSAFLFFILAILPFTPFPEAIGLASGTEINAPVCEIGGLTALIDVVVCAVQYIGFFISLMFVSVGTGYELIWLIVFSPLLVGIGWALLTLLRG